jgi:hypothetical protein
VPSDRRRAGLLPPLARHILRLSAGGHRMATARTCAAIWLEYKSAPPALTVSLARYSLASACLPNIESQVQLELCGTACNGNAFSHQLPSDSHRSSFAPKRQSTRCIVAHGVRQLARPGLGASRSRNLGRGIHELQRGVARIEPTAGTSASRRQALVPDDRRQAAGTSGTDRSHLYSASTRALTAPTSCP